MKKVVFFILSVVLFGCSPQKQLSCLLSRHPELHSDSVIVLRDTFVTEHIRTDTCFLVSDHVDEPVRLSAGNASVELVLDRQGRANMHVEQRSDTVIRVVEKPIPVYLTKTKTVEKPIHPFYNFLIWCGAISLLVLLCIVIVRLVQRYKLRGL